MKFLSNVMRNYALLFAFVLAVGETLVIIKTNKYWPLSLDDYIAIAVLAGLAWNSQKSPKLLAMIPAVWAFVVGNLYAMLFTRLDPVFGSGERISLLIVALAAATAGLVGAILVWRNSVSSKQKHSSTQ